MRPDSRAVHAGRAIGPRDSLSPPIFQTSVYVYDDLDDYDAVAAGEVPGHLYGRNSNENVQMLESAICTLEEGEAGLGTSSGMAALLVTLLSLAPRPAPIVFPPDLYGVTLGLLQADLEPAGYELRTVDLEDEEGLERALPGAAVLLFETISNPLIKVADVERVCGQARRHDLAVVVDNTFATPILCRPLSLGATAVVHSVTKYIGGHSDLLAGVMVGPTPLVEQARARAVRFGTTLGPFEAWLALRGTRTLALRMERHSRNAAALADALSALQAVERVHYPSQEVAARTLGGGCGGMLAFDLAGGRDSVQQMVARLRMVRFAASLGGVETTISYPEITSHRGLTPEQRSARGIKPGTVRVSVGIEDAEDIVEDFRQAIG